MQRVRMQACWHVLGQHPGLTAGWQPRLGGLLLGVVTAPSRAMAAVLASCCFHNKHYIIL